MNDPSYFVFVASIIALIVLSAADAIQKRRQRRTDMDFLREEPGWFGAFTRNQDPNGYPNGTTIVKANNEKGDYTPVGTKGTVLGSFSFPNVRNGEVFYFVEWENRPRWAVGVIAHKLEKAT